MDRLDFIRTAIAGGQLPHAFLLEGEDALPAAELIAETPEKVCDLLL